MSRGEGIEKTGVKKGMRVNKPSLKGREGEIAVTAETLDDLWHLKYIIEKETWSLRDQKESRYGKR
jgi:stalled ribosome rescue protein Dom34